MVQDRQFNPDGSLLYPVAPASANGPWIGEYFGDVMLVNGKIWPKLTVEPAVYRFRVLNGCNARILDLRITTADGRAAVPMVIIGTEGGLLPVNPAGTHGLVMAPAERYDVICDFRRFAGQTAAHDEHRPAGPGIHAGAAADTGHADHGEAEGVQRRADERARARVAAGQPEGDGADQPGAAEAQRRVGRDPDDHAERGRGGHPELEAEPQRAPVRRPATR